MDGFDTARFFKWLSFGLVVLLVAAVPLGLVGPTRPDTESYDEATRNAISIAELNEDSASGAPQQAVVNGWLARDLMLIQIEQNNDELALQHLLVVMLVAGVLAVVIAGIGATTQSAPQAAEVGVPIPF